MRFVFTRTQWGLVRAGKLGTAYVPPAVAARWKPNRSYVAARVCELVEDERTVRDTGYHVTVIGVGAVQTVASLVGRIEADPGYWKLLYPGPVGACVWVAFALGDWRDRPRLLAATRQGSDERGYTATPGLALDDAECVDDEWLGRFAKTASPFIEAKQAERRLRREAAQGLRSKRFLEARRAARRA
jgi:hypothetical protein